MLSVYWDTNVGLILTVQFGSTLCISYSNVETVLPKSLANVVESTFLNFLQNNKINR